MPRVLLVTQPTDGGVFRHVRDLAAGLPMHGFDVVVGGPFDSERAGELQAATVTLELVRAVSPVADARAVAAFVRVVRAVRPDLIHAHSSKAGAVARLARVANPRVPVVYTPHGYAHAGYFPSRTATSAYALVERALAPLATRVICVCEAERRLAVEVGPARRTRVVHNGIAPGEPPGAPRLEPDGPVLCAASLLRPGKGVETLLDAMPQVLTSSPGARLVIAGDGPERAALEARARAASIDHAVRFLGRAASLADVTGAADVFVSPSWAESFPYTVLEAMALGRPVVATDVGGVREAVVHGRTGLLVPRDDPAALAEAVLALISDRHRAQRLGAAARGLVLDRFTVERMVGGVASVYRELVPWPAVSRT
jgi:glycosyltransferase involved in cell wall biosynthesis